MAIEQVNRDEEGAPLVRDRGTFRATVTEEHAIVLPDEVLRYLGIGPGDVITITTVALQADLRGDRWDQKATIEAPPADPAATARGLLQEYFKDREDIRRFLAEERGYDPDAEDPEG